MTRQVAQIVADGSPGGGDDDYPADLDGSLVGKKCSEEQNGFTRHGQAGVFQHHAQKDCPVTVVRKESGEELE